MQSYPLVAHIRKHGPQGLDNYRTYKPWLRDEFTFRCIYCLEREKWYPNGHAGFGVDHIKPKVHYAHLECDYENLLYACNRCNSAKGSCELIDPTQSAMGNHLVVDAYGKITSLTTEGKTLIMVLGLDSEMVTATRQQYLRIARLYATFPKNPDVRQLYLDAFGFPSDLPNLHDLRPKTNSRPHGCEASYFVRAANKDLDLVYFI